MAKPNEWWMLKRAAKHIAHNFANNCWEVDADWWSFYETIRLLQWAAEQIPNKQATKRKRSDYFG